jgi:hypothetical protein
MPDEESFKKWLKKKLGKGHGPDELVKTIEKDVKQIEHAIQEVPKVGKRDKIDKILLYISIVLGVIILGIFTVMYIPPFISQKQLLFESSTTTTTKPTTTTTPTRIFVQPNSTVLILKTIDESKLQIISKNPDLIFNYNWPDPLGGATYQDIPKEVWSPWYGNFSYIAFPDKIGLNETGILIVNPTNISAPKFLSQNLTLPFKNITLVVKVTNLKYYLGSKCKCSDSIIKIKINEDTIYEDVIDSRDGWKTIALDISKYAGKNITFTMEGHAGGPCGKWCDEFPALDKFYVAVQK